MTQQEQKFQTGADVIVETLEARGVSHVFGVPGAKIDKVYDRLLDSSIQTVVCRHEQNAAFIAGGIGRMTGKAGVALVTSGPGVSNLATGLVTANSEGDPIVASSAHTASTSGTRAGVSRSARSRRASRSTSCALGGSGGRGGRRSTSFVSPRSTRYVTFE